MSDSIKFTISDKHIDADELLRGFKNFLNVAKQFNRGISFNATVESGSSVYRLMPKESIDAISFIRGKNKIENTLNDIYNGKRVNLPKYQMQPVKNLINNAKKNEYNFSVEENKYETNLLYKHLNDEQNLAGKKEIFIPKNNYTMLCTVRGIIYQIGNAKNKQAEEFIVIDEEDNNPIRCLIDNIDKSYHFFKEKEKVIIRGEIDFNKNNVPLLMRVDFLKRDTVASLVAKR